MKLPETLAAWTFESVLALVAAVEYEPGPFDFKVVLDATTATERGKVNDSIARTACGMANAGGGYIIFGVRDRRRGGDAIERITGIPNVDLRKHFADKLVGIEPSIGFDTVPAGIPIPDTSERVLFAVQVFDSPLRPHAMAGTFFKRGPGGKVDPMTLLEVREQMLSSEERLRKVRMLELELKSLALTADWLLRSGTDVQLTMHRLDVSVLKVLIADICVLLPPDGAALNELLEVSRFAGLVNRALDVSTTPSGGRAYTGLGEQPKRDLQRHLQEVVSKTERCVEVLKPLGGLRN